MLYVFCDTMVFLHYRLFTEIDFQSLMKVESVTLVVPDTVSKEIDKHKDTSNNKRLRERAKKVSSKIAELIDNMDDMTSWTTAIKKGYFFKFLPHKAIDFEPYGLDPNSGDHKIIAAILDFRSDHQNDEIVFFTHDNGATITARTNHISTQKLPDCLKLEDDLSEEEQRIKKLEAEVAKLKDLRPKLSLVHKRSQKTTIEYTKKDLKAFYIPENITPFDVIVNSVPPYEEKQSPDETNPEELTKDAYLSPVSRVLRNSKYRDEEKNDIKRYMRERDCYFSNYKSYLKAIEEYRLKIIIPVELQLLNTGTVPGEEIDLHIHFPDGFQMYSEDKIPKIPSPPQKPIPPRTYIEMLASRLDVSRLSSPVFSRMNDDLSQIMVPPSFTLKKTNSYEFDESFDQIKHGEHIKTDVQKLYMIFDSPSCIKSFSADFIISGSNIPDAVSGKLNFVFELSQSKKD